jgi:ribonuclease P protein component
MRAYASMRRSGEFSRLRQRGQRISAGVLTLYRAEPVPSDSRSVVGITVGKPVGGAVTRNLVRRRIAAILRESLAGRRMRLLVIARPESAQMPFARLRDDLQAALR